MCEIAVRGCQIQQQRHLKSSCLFIHLRACTFQGTPTNWRAKRPGRVIFVALSHSQTRRQCATGRCWQTYIQTCTRTIVRAKTGNPPHRLFVPLTESFFFLIVLCWEKRERDKIPLCAQRTGGAAEKFCLILRPSWIKIELHYRLCVVSPEHRQVRRMRTPTAQAPATNCFVRQIKVCGAKNFFGGLWCCSARRSWRSLFISLPRFQMGAINHDYCLWNYHGEHQRKQILCGPVWFLFCETLSLSLAVCTPTWPTQMKGASLLLYALKDLFSSLSERYFILYSMAPALLLC